MADLPSAQDDRVRILVVEDDAAARVGFQQLLTSWGYAVEAAVDGEDALAKVAGLPPGHRPQRSRHAQARRHRPAPRPAAGRRRRHHGHPDGAGHGRHRRRSAQAGRLRLPREAGRLPAPAHPARQDHRTPGDAARSQDAPPATARARLVRIDDRRQPPDARGLPPHRAGGADHRLGADHRRIGHGQGTGRADDPPPEPPGRRRRGCRSTARPSPRRCWSRSCSATSAARSPGPSSGRRAASNSRTAARCSSTKSRR